MKCQVNLKKVLKVLLNVVYILVIRFCFVGIYSNNFIHSIKDKKYDVPVKLYKGEFSVPVSGCTRLQKSTIVKFWKSKGKFTCDENTLFYNFVIVLYAFFYILP